MKKSIHFHNSRFRDCLMDISTNCSETVIGSFIDNIDDMNVLVNSLSTSVRNFLENGFSKTIYT